MQVHRRSKTSTLASSCEALWKHPISQMFPKDKNCVFIPRHTVAVSGLQRAPWHFHHFLLKSSSQPQNLPTSEPLISLVLFLYFIPAGDKDFLLC